MWPRNFGSRILAPSIAFFSTRIVILDLKCQNSQKSKNQLNTDLTTLAALVDALRWCANACGPSGYSIAAFREAATATGPALAAIGPIIRLIIASQPRNEEMKRMLSTITSNFSEMHTRFSALESDVRTVSIYNEYIKQQQVLHNMRSRIAVLESAWNNPNAVQELRNLHSIGDPALFLEWIYCRIVKEDHVSSPFIKTIVRDLKFEKANIGKFFHIVSSDVLEAAYLKQTCLSVLYPNDTDLLQQYQTDMSTKTSQIIEELTRNLEEIPKIDNDHEFGQGVLDYLKKWLDVWEPSRPDWLLEFFEDMLRDIRNDYLKNKEKYKSFETTVAVFDHHRQKHAMFGYPAICKVIDSDSNGGRRFVIGLRGKNVPEDVLKKTEALKKYVKENRCYDDRSKWTADEVLSHIRQWPLVKDCIMILVVKSDNGAFENFTWSLFFCDTGKNSVAFRYGRDPTPYFGEPDYDYESFDIVISF